MREITVRKIGDSLGIVLPDDIIARLQTKEGGSIGLLETSTGTFELGPQDALLRDHLAIAEDIMNEYDEALRELAK